MPSVELPVEIWRRILDLIPQERTKLYGVNRMFFEIIMAWRYKSLSWGYIMRENPRDVYALKSPHISRYIQELCIHITPSRFFTIPPSKKTVQHRVFRVKQSDRPLLKVKPNEAQEVLDGFATPVDMSTHLPSLQLLAISAGTEPWEVRHYHHFQTTFQTSIRHATQGIAATIRVISLTLPIEYIRDGIFSCDVSFPLLQDFSMRLSAVYLTTDYEAVFGASVVPFVNRHSQTITKLSFATAHPRDGCPQRVYSLKALMGGLSHIQGLTSFSLHWFILPSLEAGLHELSQFIHAHSPSLSALTLYLFHSFPSEFDSHNKRSMSLSFKEISSFYTPSTLLLHPLFTHSLSSCRMLKKVDCILMDKDTFQTNDAAPFLRWFPTMQSASTLTTLRLSLNWFNQADLVKLVSSVDFSSLRDLSIRCRSLSVTMFDVFSDRLGSLQVLRVDISGIATKANPKEAYVPKHQLDPDSPFLLELHGSCYPTWTSLTELHLPLEDEDELRGRLYLSCCWGCWEESWLCQTQVSETFPNLQNFSAKIN